jgi:hypothetical protein
MCSIFQNTATLKVPTANASGGGTHATKDAQTRNLNKNRGMPLHQGIKVDLISRIQILCAHLKNKDPEKAVVVGGDIIRVFQC